MLQPFAELTYSCWAQNLHPLLVIDAASMARQEGMNAGELQYTETWTVPNMERQES